MGVDNAEHTFVILGYKQSKYMEDCIKSVLNQSVPGKVIIATSTPNPHIQSLADKYNIQVKVNDKGGSIGKDWNFGLSSANTKYVTLAHQDDIYLPDFAQKCIEAANTNSATKPLIVFNKSITYKGDKALAVSFKNIIRWLLVFPFHFKRCIAPKGIKKSILLFRTVFRAPGVFYVKQNLSHFKFDEEAKYILDWKAWYEMSLMDGPFIYVSDELHIHREHGESATSVTQLETLQQEEFTLLSKIWGNKFMPRIITKLLVLAK